MHDRRCDGRKQTEGRKSICGCSILLLTKGPLSIDCKYNQRGVRDGRKWNGRKP
jgi:hypothetical protein